MNSNAVPETQVMGHRAGLAAASAGMRDRAGRVDERMVETWQRRLEGVRRETADASPEFDAILVRTQESMWLGLGIVRTAEGLRTALHEVGEIREWVSAAPKEAVGDLVAAIELEDLCTVGTAVAHSALTRSESRAAHYREDYPSTDPGWVATVAYDGERAYAQPVARDLNEDLLITPRLPKAPTAEEFVE